jgi:hypothetical protein
MFYLTPRRDTRYVVLLERSTGERSFAAHDPPGKISKAYEVLGYTDDLATAQKAIDVQLCIACGLPAMGDDCKEMDGPHRIVRTVGGDHG